MTTLHLNGTDEDKKTAKKLQRNTGVQSGVNHLLYLGFVDPTRHTPVELLHTALLGISRYMMTELNKQLVKNNRKTPQQRTALSAWIDTTYRRDMPSTITAANLLEYSKSFVGREYKLLMEIGFYLFRTVLTRRVDDSDDPEPIEDNNRVIEHTATAVDDINNDPMTHQEQGFEYDSGEEDDNDEDSDDGIEEMAERDEHLMIPDLVIPSTQRRGRPSRRIHEPVGNV
jgi:hypothetical protein